MKLCPLKFSGDTISRDGSCISKYCQCEEEKCAWWISKRVTANPGEMVLDGADEKTVDVGCCAMVLIMIKTEKE